MNQYIRELNQASSSKVCMETRRQGQYSKIYYLHEALVNSQIYLMDILVFLIYLQFFGYNLLSKMLDRKHKLNIIFNVYSHSEEIFPQTIQHCTKQRNSPLCNWSTWHKQNVIIKPWPNRWFRWEFYLINKTSTAQFSGETMPKNFFETLLMMIIPISSRVIDSPNIKNSIKTLQHLEIQSLIYAKSFKQILRHKLPPHSFAKVYPKHIGKHQKTNTSNNIKP